MEFLNGLEAADAENFLSDTNDLCGLVDGDGTWDAVYDFIVVGRPDAGKVLGAFVDGVHKGEFFIEVPICQWRVLGVWLEWLSCAFWFQMADADLAIGAGLGDERAASADDFNFTAREGVAASDLDVRQPPIGSGEQDFEEVIPSPDANHIADIRPDVLDGRI